MTTTIDARGLSCPQPVLMTLGAMASGSDAAYTVLVDTDTSRENVTRAAESRGYFVEKVEPDGTGFRLELKKRG